MCIRDSCSSSCLSKTDLDEADHSGAFAVNAALNGETGKMISFVRANTSPYLFHNYLICCKDIKYLHINKKRRVKLPKCRESSS